jgi:hypothetical protein
LTSADLSNANCKGAKFTEAKGLSLKFVEKWQISTKSYSQSSSPSSSAPASPSPTPRPSSPKPAEGKSYCVDNLTAPKTNYFKPLDDKHPFFNTWKIKVHYRLSFDDIRDVQLFLVIVAEVPNIKKIQLKVMNF